MAKRQFTAEEKTQTILEGMRTSITIAELCRKHSIYETQFYKWREGFIGSHLGGQFSPPRTEEALKRRVSGLLAF